MDRPKPLMTALKERLERRHDPYDPAAAPKQVPLIETWAARLRGDFVPKVADEVDAGIEHWHPARQTYGFWNRTPGRLMFGVFDGTYERSDDFDD
jgi:hypothetical protein